MIGILFNYTFYQMTKSEYTLLALILCYWAGRDTANNKMWRMLIDNNHAQHNPITGKRELIDILVIKPKETNNGCCTGIRSSY